MLGNPLYDRGVFFQQFFIPLLGVFFMRERKSR